MVHHPLTNFAPRALRRRQTVSVAITPFELYVLIEALESRASLAADNPETVDLADHWFDRVAELRGGRPVSASRTEGEGRATAIRTTASRPTLTLSLDRNAHHQHAIPDAETLAWNRAREAEWHAAPATLEAMLRELAPAVFNDSPPPLAIGIDVALIALLADEFEASVVARFLADWTRRSAYLAAVARGHVRRDLDGCPADAPEDGARAFAAILLGRRGGAS